MKTTSSRTSWLLLALAPLLGSCTSTRSSAPAAPSASITAGSAKVSKHVNAAPAKEDETDEYATAEISDPLEPMNRATFRLNDKMYKYLFRPISKGYETVFPRPVRKGVDNAFENARYPVRFVNCTLQFKFKHAGQETEKFVINTVVGIGGLWKPTDKIPSLADIQAQDTGLTFASWGMGHGSYLVLPFLGPSSVRDGAGLVGDYALNPVNWGIFWHGRHDWTMIPPTVNTLRALPPQLSLYDAATKDAVDPYISVRSAYVQNRAEAAKK